MDINFCNKKLTKQHITLITLYGIILNDNLYVTIIDIHWISFC